MEGDHVRINHWLLPLSWLYGAGVWLRNLCFDVGILKSQSYDIPVICVGNITVGGTGKTPHVEFLIRMLKEQYRVAVLSRGYKRSSKGYVLASADTPMTAIGDEPWQMKQKFPDVYVAVDSNRRRGIERLRNDAETKDVQVILLDDAFQHRYVKPSCSILLVDYHRMVTDDCLLPAGRLREGVEALSRANMVIVSKCPQNITPMGFRILQSALNLRPFQHLFFSTLQYGKAKQIFGKGTMSLQNIREENMQVLLLTGIGNPLQMEQDIHSFTPHVTPLTYPDHHNYTPSDIKDINERFSSLPQPRIIITTEKDAARLLHVEGLSEEVRNALYALPIEIQIMRSKKNTLTEKILSYVHKNP